MAERGKIMKKKEMCEIPWYLSVPLFLSMVLVGPVLGGLYGLTGWLVGHQLQMGCVSWCPGWWAHPLAMIIGVTYFWWIVSKFFREDKTATSPTPITYNENEIEIFWWR